eukprot:Amastigsp_a843300_14.p1 type:complete len:634 gc:universal Amastigsp_a843300_14:27-1928(+)
MAHRGVSMALRGAAIRARLAASSGTRTGTGLLGLRRLNGAAVPRPATSGGALWRDRSGLGALVTRLPRSAASEWIARGGDGVRIGGLRLYSVPASPEHDEKSKDKSGVAAAEPSRLARMWATVKTEAKHYWASSKALGAEFKIAFGILKAMSRGHTLTRRERRQLVRTGADLIRLIPLVIVIVVPFMELALPALLYLFPNMLPSTFEDKNRAAEATKKQLQARIGLAKFLQAMNVELLADDKIKASDSAAELVREFRARIARGETVDNTMVHKIAQLFGDKLTLQNLNREQLTTLCQYLGVTTYGTTSYLRSRLTKELAALRADDMAIHAEGVSSLSEEELRAAVIARGMRGNGVSVEKLRAQLSSWLDLHLLEEVPASLLLLSRAMLLADKVSPDVQLKATIAALPEAIVEQVRADVKADAAETSKEKDLQERLERVKLESSAAAETSAAAAANATGVDDQKKLVALKATVLALASDSPVGVEKSELESLKSAKEAAAPVVASADRTPVSKVAKKLDAKVDSILGKIEKDIAKVEAELQKELQGKSVKTIDLNADGKISAEELRTAVSKMATPLSESQIEELMRRIDRDRDGEITLDELTAYVDKLLAQPAQPKTQPKSSEPANSFAPPKQA